MKVKLKFLAALVVSLGIICFFTACPWDTATTNYTITYVSEHGTTPDPVIISGGSTLNDSYLPTLQEDGYTFLGWYLNGAKVMKGSFTVTYDITLTAKWEKVVPKYKVTYSTDYGTAPDEIEVEENSKLTADQLTALSYEGFSFNGWLDETGTLVEPDTFAVTKDITLKASWTKNPVYYKVTYSTEYGTAPEAIEVEENTKLTAAQLKTLTYDGYTFNGWLNEAGTLVEADKFAVTKAVTLKASWTKNPVYYKVTYSTEYGTAPETIEVLENTKLTADQLKTLTCDDCIFNGWLDETGTLVEADKFTVTKAVTLKASWTKKTGKLSFTFEVKDFADVKLTATPNEATKEITISVADTYSSYEWTITKGSKKETYTTSTVTLTEDDYKYGAYVFVIVDSSLSAQYFVKGE